MKILFLYVCIGKYVVFWKDFFLSVEKYVLTDCEKHYFVFTDSKKFGMARKHIVSI